MKTTFTLNSRLFVILFFAVSISVSAQVGIGTTTPQATLDITGQPLVTSQLDGVIPPRLTGNQLRTKVYTAAQTAAIVYVTAADSTPLGQTINVTQAGYYYFNGTLWIRMAPESDDWKITGNSNTNASNNFLGTTNDVDLIFKRNNVHAGWLQNANPSAPTIRNGNTAFGFNTLNPTNTNTTATTGVYNTAIGETALVSNTDGHRNTAIGSGALSDNTTGFQNTAMGRYTMHFNISGYNNMAIGQEAAKWNSTGHDNAAIGFNALRQNGTGSYNVAIGRSSLAYDPTPGTDNIENIGNNNIAIGANAQVPVNTDNNQLVLGGAPGTAIDGTSTAITRTIINGIVNPAGGRPASSSAAGVQGEIRVINQGTTYHLYIYCSDNLWRRTSLSTF